VRDFPDDPLPVRIASFEPDGWMESIHNTVDLQTGCIIHLLSDKE
jgi:hypothetical protein